MSTPRLKGLDLYRVRILFLGMLIDKNFAMASIFLVIPCIFSGCVMGKMMGGAGIADPLKSDRDSGVIGEKKTIRPIKTQYEESTGSTFRFTDKGNFATPQVIGSVAKFDSGSAVFEFESLGWKYQTQNYWSNADETSERISPSVKLESPDKKDQVYIYLVDLPVGPPLNVHSIAPKQTHIIQEDGSVEEPFVGEESLIAARQAVEWYLNQRMSDFIVSEKNMAVHFTTENINGKEFVRAELDILNDKNRTAKKSIIWAYNYRAFWLYDGKRHAWTWIAQMISDPSEYQSTMVKARQMPETVEFKKYPLQSQPRKKVPGVRYLNNRGEGI